VNLRLAQRSSLRQLGSACGANVISHDLNAPLFQSLEAALSGGDKVVQLTAIETRAHLAEHREVVSPMLLRRDGLSHSWLAASYSARSLKNFPVSKSFGVGKAPVAIRLSHGVSVWFSKGAACLSKVF
jgi:hypothetical protein